MQPHTCPCYTFAGSLSDLGSADLQKKTGKATVGFCSLPRQRQRSSWLFPSRTKATFQRDDFFPDSVSPAKICSSTNCLRLELSTFTLKKMDLCTDGIFSRPDLGHTVK
jgi:hypothetical protein